MHTYNHSLYQDQSPDHPHGHRYHSSSSRTQQLPIVNPTSASINPPDFKLPQVQYLNQTDPTINFKTQTLKLLQANAVLTQLIKDTLLQKYSLTEKIIQVSEKIRRLENPHLSVPQSQSTVNFQQGGGSGGNVSGLVATTTMGQYQR